MSQPERILFVSGEVAPFVDHTGTASLARSLPEQLKESGSLDARIMMPRYGTISVRKNRLHEVIRLSGTDIDMGAGSETLDVMVASIPDARLQVYFMDNERYFKRKGLHADEHGDLFEDNAERALFFGRAVLETLLNLRWAPDVIHSFGWISSLIPVLLRSEYAEKELFEAVSTVYTPDDIDADAHLTSELAGALGLNGKDQGLLDQPLTKVGLHRADVSILPPAAEIAFDGAPRLSEDEAERSDQLLSLYDGATEELAV